MRLKPCGKTCCGGQDSQFAGQLHLKSGGPAEHTDLMAKGKTWPQAPDPRRRCSRRNDRGVSNPRSGRYGC